MTTDLTLPVTTYSNGEANIQALRVPDDNYSYWNPELEAQVAEAIRRYPDMDAPWWLAPSAVLNVIERWLLSQQDETA